MNVLFRCASLFNSTSQLMSSHICNTAIVEKLLKEKNDDIKDQERLRQADKAELESYIDWDFDGLQDILLSEGRIQDKEWVHKHFYPLIYRTLIHMIRSTQGFFYRDSRFSEFLAVDFILDNDLRIWALELNFNPQILSVTSDRIRRNYRMIDVHDFTNFLQETIQISFALLRSKY